MRSYLDGVRARGQSVSALWATEAPIYGRFGYGMASLQGEAELSLERAAFVSGPHPAARARLVDEADALEAFPAIFDAIRTETPGMLTRSRRWWQLRRLSDPEFARRGRGPLRRVLLELEGAPVAYALYRQTHEWQNAVPGGSVHVIEALGTTPAATRAIWRYLCDLDLMDKLTGFMLPSDHPLLLLVAEPRRLGLRLADALWVRLVEVGAALSARSFGEGSPITIEIRDSFCPWNEGRWSVGAGVVERTDERADLALDAAALGSVYLGGFTFGQLARAGLVEEFVEAAVERADALFVRDRAPWCPEIF